MAWHGMAAGMFLIILTKGQYACFVGFDMGFLVFGVCKGWQRQRVKYHLDALIADLLPSVLVAWFEG